MNIKRTKTYNVLTLVLLCVAVYILKHIWTSSSEREISIEHQREIPIEHQREIPIEHQRENSIKRQRKIFLDCGANMASSVLLFREIYPNGKEYEIYSFEIDDRLKPYFAAYKHQSGINVNIPLGVAAKNGGFTAYLEGAWYPGKLNNERDMQWGGGTLFVKDEEKNAEDGGYRKLSHRVTVPTVDLSQWIQKNTRKEDYVILKLDVEGAEFEILEKMLKDHTFEWIDKFYGEYHSSQPTGFDLEARKKIYKQLKDIGVKQITWAGEEKSFSDFDELYKLQGEDNVPGAVGEINNKCPTMNGKTLVSIVVEIGMNLKAASLLVETLKAYAKDVPLTLFVYGDFVEEHPELIKEWSLHYEIGIRGSSPMPNGLWELQNNYLLRLSIVSAMTRLMELKLVAKYVLPTGFNENVISVTKDRNLRPVDSTIRFPPKDENLLTYSSYFEYRDVERIPKALAVIHNALADKGGILSLDSDFPDSYIVSTFLLDYLYLISDHTIVGLRQCLAGS